MSAASRPRRLMRVAAWRSGRKLSKVGLGSGSPAQHGTLLAIFALGAAALLSFAADGTRDAIAERAAEDLRKSLAQVVPDAVYDNNLAEDYVNVTDREIGAFPVHQARRGDDVIAAAFEVVGQGYSGAIRVLVGIDREGRLLGVRVLAHTETPGLGDKIEAARSDWILSFDGLSLGDPPQDQWKVKKDGGRFDQFAGATITPRAVVAAIVESLKLFHRNKAAILNTAEAG